jgi:predicted NUDIX family phosphoesterase
LNKDNELVLVFDENRLYGFKDLYLEGSILGGVSTDTSDLFWFRKCLENSYFIPRGKAETDPSFKQVIPYLVLKIGDMLFTYQRKGSEERLYDNYSIGFGGHINRSDYGFTDSIRGTLYEAAKRELREELNFDKLSYSDRCYLLSLTSTVNAILYDPSNMVGKVHFGAVYILKLPQRFFDVLNVRDEGVKIDWLTKEQLIEHGDKVENWSRMVLEKLL